MEQKWNEWNPLYGSMTKLPDIHKIAVVRANALGDFIFILPALEALKSAYPEAEIVLLAKQWHQDFLKDRPSPVQRVEVVPPCEGVGVKPGTPTDQQELDHFFRRMQEEQFDLAIQMHGGGRYSNPFVRRLEAKFTIGLKTPDAQPLDRWIPYVYFQTEISRYIEVVSLVGAIPATIEPHLTVTPSDYRELHHYLPEETQRLVVLHPGASEPRRRWPPQKFADIGNAMMARGATVVVTGSKNERDLTDTLVGLMQPGARNLCDCLSLGGLAALLSQASVVISNDTGPMHLGHAVGGNTVGIFWAYNELTADQMTRRRHRPVINWNTRCPECGQDNSYRECEHQVSFVSDIPVAAVLEPALELFEMQAFQESV
jgi:ADP-heptose:LPS heptosyltransferase